MKITTIILNHPIIDLGYKIEADDAVLVTVYDHEPYRNLFEGSDDDTDDEFDQIARIEGEKSARLNNMRVAKFMRNADLLIHDAQYTNREYLESKIGWGHSPMEYVVYTSVKFGVKKLALFHHDPTRKDEELDKLEKIIKNRVKRVKSSNIEVFFAREGLEISL